MISFCDKIVFATNYLENAIRDYLLRNGIGNVLINHEDEPLGTGGAIRNAKDVLSDEFLVLNGDIISDCSLDTLPRLANPSRPYAMVATHMDDVSRYGLLELHEGAVAGFREKDAHHKGGGWINAGMYFFTSDVFDYIPSRGASSIERDVFPLLAEEGRLSVLRHTGAWHDIGTREDYIRANVELSGTTYVAAPDCTIERSTIQNSVLLPGARVVGSTVKDAIIGYGVSLRDAAVTGEIVV
jgi:NDP-sugar pyrophosphorylase family protein